MRVAVNAGGASPIAVKRIEDACLKVLRAEGARKDSMVSVTFVDEAEMEDMNRRYLEREGATDVLAFPMGEEDGGSYLLGDVVVCAQHVLVNRGRYGVEKGRELEFVAAHGVLHLLGHGDEDEEGASAMESRQREILGLAGRETR